MKLKPVSHSVFNGFARGVSLALVAFFLPMFVSTAAETTNSYTGASGGAWDTASDWSSGAPGLWQSWVIVTNTGVKTVSIVDSTSSTSLTISNLDVSAPVASTNTISLSTTNTLTVLQNVILGSGGALAMSNATVDVQGQSGGFVTVNGGVTIDNGATFSVTNAFSTLDIGRNGAGSLTVNGGLLQAIGQKVGTFAGDRGTLTIAGGTNIVTANGLLIGDSADATGVVWIASGALVETNTSVYVGNVGSGRLAVSNGSVLARQLIIGNSGGGAGTLTVAGGNVETPDTGLLFPVLLGQFADGTGTVWVTGGSFVSTNGTPRIGDSGVGTIVVSNGTVLLRRAVLGYTAGAGTLSVAGGSLRITGTGSDFSIGDAPTTRGTVLLSGGELVMTNDVANELFVGNYGFGEWTQSGGTGRVVNVILGNNPGGLGTLTVGGGLLTGSGSLTVGEAYGGSGTVWLTGGTISFTNAGTFLGGPTAAGAMTVSNGTAELGDFTVGDLGNGALTIAGGTLQASSSFTVANGLGSSPSSLTQTGGWLITTNGTTYLGAGGSVNALSSGGTWLAGLATFAYGNVGTFTVNGGTNIFNGGFNAGSSGGSGFVWVTSGRLTVTNGTTTIGGGSPGKLTVSNGIVQLQDVTVSSGSLDGRLLIAGGTTTLGGPLTVGTGFGASGSVVVTSGSLTGTNVTLGLFFSTGTLTVSGGNVQLADVTLGPPPGGSGRLIMNGGVLGLSKLMAPGPSSFVNFSNGTLNSAGAAVSNSLQFAVGNGITSATYHLLGGIHAFGNGLRIRTNSFLTGCGTITGTVVVEARATVIADCGGLLTFANSVTNNGTMRAVNGSLLEFYGTVVNRGLIDVIFGSTNFHGAFINNGIVLDADSDYDGDGLSNLAEKLAGTDPTNNASAFRVTAVAREGDDMRVTWTMGSGKTNALQWTAGGVSGSYTNDFVTDLFIVTNTVGTITNYLDAGAATNFPSRFYRIRLVP